MACRENINDALVLIKAFHQMEVQWGLKHTGVHCGTLGCTVCKVCYGIGPLGFREGGVCPSAGLAPRLRKNRRVEAIWLFVLAQTPQPAG